MRFDFITIFPDQIANFIKEGIFRIAAENGVEFAVHDLRNWSKGKHKQVDDHPYGGGPGMVLMVEPIHKAVTELRMEESHVVLTAAGGTEWTASKAKSMAKREHLIIICGHYEGVDHRVKEHIADEEISIGTYVLSGGELPALVIADATVRFLPSVLGNPDSLSEESFENGSEGEYPQYTRPDEYCGWSVPEVLLSGDHQRIKKWRKEKQS